jgi:hypothetical protein
MNQNRSIGLCAGLALASFGGVLGGPSKAGAQPVTVTPATMPQVATIDERYLSYNIEMAEVIGGNFWKPYDASGNAGQQTPSTGADPPPAARA